MDIVRRWKRTGLRLLDTLMRPRDAKIFVEEIEFSGGQKIKLTESSILVIVGPNNAGKSSVLREIREHLLEGWRFGPVLRNANISVRGTADAFKRQIREAGLSTEKLGIIKIGWAEYPIDRVDEDIKKGFIGSRAVPLFFSYLGAEERLQITDPTSRGDYLASAPKNPMQWLELDNLAEKRISDIFEKTFGSGLILNTFAGEKLVLHIVNPDDIRNESNSTRDEAKWLASLPRLHRQGDGMRSFAGTAMGLLVHPTSAIFLDEPEAFLHPPQARKLAQLVATEVPGECQVIVATHNDAFVRALLDVSGDRLILARIVRHGSENIVTVLDQAQLEEMWNDPLIRTSDVLSALFHEAAILCEGDSDARFFGALLDATSSEDRDSDVRLFHFGGKDRIPSIARALRLVQIPVVAIVDIDILSEREKFFTLFEAMGGLRAAIENDVRNLIQSIMQRKGQLTGSELAVELRRLAAEVEATIEVSKQARGKLLEFGRAASNWARVKQDGFRALDVPTFTRISEACQQVGLLINPEGELEGFCRTVPRTNKSDWLVHVIRKDLASDPVLSDARDFAAKIRATTRAMILRRPS
jgi:AAA domain, putative AbiEii toxin, Type IV TA system